MVRREQNNGCAPLRRAAAILLVVVLLPACGDSDRSSTPRRAAAGDIETPVVQPRPPDPIETIELVRSYRAEGRYSKVEPFLLPVERTLVIAQLRAVDRLLSAGKLFRTRVEEKFGPLAAEPYRSYDQIGNVVGVLSADVTLVTQRVSDERATVTFRVADRLPLKDQVLVRRDDSWTLVIEPIAGVPEQILELSFLIERMTERVGAGELSAEALQDEITLRQSAILRRLSKLTAAADETEGSP